MWLDTRVQRVHNSQTLHDILLLDVAFKRLRIADDTQRTKATARALKFRRLLRGSQGCSSTRGEPERTATRGSGRHKPTLCGQQHHGPYGSTEQHHTPFIPPDKEFAIATTAPGTWCLRKNPCSGGTAVNVAPTPTSSARVATAKGKDGKKSYAGTHQLAFSVNRAMQARLNEVTTTLAARWDKPPPAKPPNTKAKHPADLRWDRLIACG